MSRALDIAPATHVFRAMGTAVSVRTHRPLPEPIRLALAEGFEELEARFSLWRPDTEATLVATGRLDPAEASPDYRRVRRQAVCWRVLTNGAFDPIRPDGSEDLSGIVKALAIRAAGDVLTSVGFDDWCINAGGDVLTAGVEHDGTPWRVGIVDPDDRTRLASAFATRPARVAVATSGYAERGDHVWRTDAERTFAQVTVCADDIITADVLATAILSGGPETLQGVQSAHAIDVLVFCRDGSVVATPAFRGE